MATLIPSEPRNANANANAENVSKCFLCQIITGTVHICCDRAYPQAPVLLNVVVHLKTFQCKLEHNLCGLLQLALLVILSPCALLCDCIHAVQQGLVMHQHATGNAHD